MDSTKEQGAASIKIELSDGVITVKHGTSLDAVLAQWTAKPGDWDRLWDKINELQGKEDK